MKTKYTPKLLGLAVLCATALTVYGGEVREEFHETYKLGQAGQVSLDNINGSVRIAAWDRNEVKVDAVKRAKKQEHLDAVRIEVNSAPENIRIKTKYPNGRNNSTSVDYTLTVPRESRLSKINTVNGSIEIERVRGDVEANSVNGRVSARGLGGETSLSTVNGSVKATVTELRKPVTLKSTNGSVTVVLPGEVNADISADTLNGGISSDFDLKVKRNFPVGQELQGKLGEGGPRVKLSTLNGGIHVDRAKAETAEEE